VVLYPCYEDLLFSFGLEFVASIFSLMKISQKNSNIDNFKFLFKKVRNTEENYRSFLVRSNLKVITWETAYKNYKAR